MKTEIIKARILSYNNRSTAFGRKPGLIQFISNNEKVCIDSITMPQGWKIGTTLDATLRDGEVVQIKISKEQEIDRTQEGLL